MSKTVFGWCCALVLVSVLYCSVPVLSQESGRRSASSSESASEGRLTLRSQDAKSVPSPSLPAATTAPRLAAERRIEYLLDQPLKSPLHFDAEALDVVMETLFDEYQIPIVFDKSALDEVAISPESEVTISLQGISLRSALNLMFKEPGLEDLTYTVEDEVLLITTIDTCNSMLIVEVYRIDDLIAEPSDGRSELRADADRFIDMLIACIEHDSWMENGTGDGELRYVHPGMLVVNQTRDVHRQIVMLLQRLRETRRVIVGPADDR